MSLIAYGDRDNPGTYDECWDGRDPLVITGLIQKHFDVGDVKWLRVMRQRDDNVQAIIFAADRRVVVAFRGSCGKNDGLTGNNNSANWRMNYLGLPLPGAAEGFEGVYAHLGWARALARKVDGSKTFYDDLADWVRKALADAGADELLITGHSMGGAMAQYFTYRFLQDGHTTVPSPLDGISGQTRYVRTNLITFGTPHAGYKDNCGSSTSLRNRFTEQNGRKGVFALQIEAQGDPIPLETGLSFKGTLDAGGVNLTASLDAICPLPLGNVQTFPGFTSDQHDLRNYIKFAHDNYFVPAWGDRISTDPGASPLTSMIPGRKIPFASINIGWSPIAGKARQVAVGVNGALWAIGVQAIGGDFEIWQAGVGAWEKRSGVGVRIAVDANARAWVVNSKGEVFQWSGSGWDPRGADARDIAIGPDGTVWSLAATPVGAGSPNGALRVWSPQNQAWQSVPNVSGVRLAGGNDRTAWVVSAEGRLVQATMTGTVTEVRQSGVHSVAAGGIGVCVTAGLAGGVDRDIWCKGAVSSWDRLAGAAVELAMNRHGRIYAVNGAGDIAISR